MNKQILKNLFIIIVAGCCSILPVRSQTLHAIVFADTKDASIGIYDNLDYINITLELSTIASATRLKLKQYYYKDSQCNNKNLVSVLSNISAAPDDVVFFYYSGHGTRSTEDNSEYPQLCLGSHYEVDFYPLEKILQKLSMLPARLKIVIGDCCNSVSPGVSPKDYNTKGPTVLTKEPVNAYCNLFLGTEGTIIASGSSKGENSTTIRYADGSPAGGTFTVSLLDVIQVVSKHGLDASWHDILAAAKSQTVKLRKHTPIYAIDVKNISAASSSNATPTITATDEDEITIIQLLTAIANENISVEARAKAMDKALDLSFASPDAKVEIVGRNGVTIVATEKASDFVLRLCTAHNLVNLVEVDGTTDENGRYTYLKIHEIYKGY